MRASRLLAALLATATLTGCGNERQRPPDPVRPLAPKGQDEIERKDAGIAFTKPANWRNVSGTLPLANTVSSNRAVVAIWRYPRAEALPRRRAELETARDRLLQRVAQRDPTWTRRSAEVTEIGGEPAVVIVGDQTIGGLRVTVRSAHVYAERAEVVVDAYTSPETFPAIDTSVFQPLIASLRISAPVAVSSATPTAAASPTASP